MNNSMKKLLHRSGSALAIIGVVIVVFRLNEYRGQLDFSGFDKTTWAVIIILVLVYSFANFLLAIAWWKILHHFNVFLLKPLSAVKIYGQTQLAKYVPGNIMHMASRQAMGLAAGIPGWPLAKASIWELALISSAGALFGIIVLPQFLSVLSVPATLFFYLTILLVITASALRVLDAHIVKAFWLYTLFLTLSGLIFVSLLTLIETGSGLDFSRVITIGAAFIVAWFVGLITPGAPAGVGVRELVLMIILKSIVIESELVLAVLLSRAITVCGDIIFYIYAIIIGLREV